MSKGNNGAEQGAETQNGGVVEKSKGKAESVKEAITLFESKLRKGEMKPTVGEYIRLLELEKEIDGDEIKEIRVTWVESAETESSNNQ
jgi:hypothetical protein